MQKKKTGKLFLIGGIAVVLVAAIVLLLTMCGKGTLNPVSTLSPENLVELLSKEEAATIRLDGDITVDVPLQVVGDKTITGTGSIRLSTEAPGQWPKSDAPTWGMGCAKLTAEDAIAMPAVLQLTQGAQLKLEGSACVNAQGNANGVLVPKDAKLTVSEEAQILGGRYANLVIAADAQVQLQGGTLADGGVHNIINDGTLQLSGGTVSGAAAGAVLFNRGSAEQTGGTVSGAAFHNVYVAAGSFTMSGGVNTSAVKDGVLVAEGASAEVTGGDINTCNHGLCNSGSLTAGKLVLTECGIMNYETGVLELNGTTVDTTEVYCLSNNGGKVTATDFVASKCDTVAVYNFSGDMLLNNLTVTGSRDGNIANAGGNMTVNGGTLGVCRDKSITVGNGKAVFNNVSIQGTNREKYGVYAYGGELILNDCAIQDVSSTAVKLDAGSYVELNRVTIQDAQQNGFQLDGGRLVVHTVSMENLGSHGVLNNGGELEAEGLIIRNSDKNAIQNKAGTTTVKGLEADTMGNHGAYIEAGVLTVTDGSFKNAAANGFYLPEGEGKLVLENVQISDVVQQGINNSATVEAKNVTISGTGMNGIYNKPGAKMTVNGANIHDVQEHGINNKSTMAVTNVTVQNSGEGSNGIQNNGTMTLTKASVSKSLNHGLYNTGKLTATDVKVDGAAKNGVYNDKQGDIRAEDLKIANTGEHGINNAATISASQVEITATGKGKNGVQNSGQITLTDCAITNSKNHGIYNTGTLQATKLNISQVTDNGIYNSKGTVTATDGVTIHTTGGQGINNTGELTATNVQVTATGKNGVYTNGGITAITGLTVTDPGEHGVSNDFSGVVTLTNATLDGSGKGSNCIQNKATMTLQNVTVKNSANHGIYNDSKLTATGILTVSSSSVNGIYNYRGKVTVDSLNIQATLGGTADSHGINNDGTMTVDTLKVDKAYANSIQNKGELTIRDSAVLTNSGKHGMYNGGQLEASNVTITTAGDILMNNGGDLVIRGLKLSGSANKAIYNAGYAELYKATVDGSKVDNLATAADQFLVDNNAGVLDLTDTTILDAKGTALHNRGKARTSVTNVVIDGAGNYGIFVGGSSVVSGDGLVVNNITKNTEVSGAEGYGIKNQGKITMMDHVTIGDYSSTVTGDGVTARKQTSGVASTAFTNDAATSSYSGKDLVLKNSGGNGVYNKGVMYVTDLVIDTANHGLVTRYDSWITLSGTASITNIKNNPVSIYGVEDKTYKNGITLTAGTEMTIDTAGSHGINNKGSFLADGTTLVVKNISGKQVNAINNNGGTMTLGDVIVDGVYVTITKNGTAININSGNGLQTNNKVTLNGTLTVKNLFYKAEGGLNDNSNGSALVVKGSGSVTGTGSVVIQGNQTVPETYVDYVGMYNGIYNESCTIELDGDVTISDTSNRGIELTTGTIDVGNVRITNIGKRGVNIYGNGKLYAKSLYIDNTVENGIQNNPGTIEIEGAAVIKNATATGGSHGIYNNGTFKAGSLEIDNVTKNGINNAATMNISGLLKVTNAVAAGIGNTKTITAGSVQIENVTAGHGINNNSVLTVSGDITVRNVSNRGINNYGSGNLSAGNITIENFGESGIQNAATLTATGDIVIRNNTTKGHGVYNTKDFTAGSLTIANIVRKGLSNDGGTVKLSGALTVDTVGEEAILNNGSITVAGATAVRNVTGTDVNAIHNKSGKTLTLKGNVTVENIKVTVSAADKTNVGNGIYTEGTVNLDGTATITNLFTSVQGNNIGAGAIAYKGGQVKGAGSLVITGSESSDTAYPYGINNGIFLDGAEATPVINLTGDITVSYVTGQGIYLANQVVAEDSSVTSTAKLTARNITVSYTGANGIYNRHSTNELTATGKITVSNITQHGVNNSGILKAASMEATTIGKNGINNNGGTVNVSGAITVTGAAEHGVSNNNIFNAASVTVTNAGTSSGNGIQNSGSGNMTVPGAVTIEGVVNGHGMYNAKTASFGSYTSANTSKNGINNGGSLTVTGAITVSGAGADGVSNGGGKTLTAGSLTVQDIDGTNGNAVNNSGTMTLGGLTVKNIRYTISADEKGNGVLVKGTLNLSGDATIQNVTTPSNTNDTKCHGIYLVGGTVNCTGQITVTVDGTARAGLFMKGGTFRGTQATLSVKNTAKTMIAMNTNAVLDVKTITATEGGDQGIQLDDTNTLTAETVVVSGVPQNGLRLKNANANPAVNITTLVCIDCANYAIASNKAITTAEANIGTLYWYGCKNVLHANIQSGVVGQVINENPLAAASAAEDAAN